MEKFRKGDRVKVLDTPKLSQGITAGQTGTVVEGEHEMPVVLLDGDKKKRKGIFGGTVFFDDELELIKS